MFINRRRLWLGCFLRRQGLSQCFIRAIRYSLIHTLGEHTGDLAQLFSRQTDPQTGQHVGVQLRLRTGCRGQGTYGGQLTALPVKVVTLKNVAEQMGLQVLIDDRRELEQRPLLPHRLAVSLRNPKRVLDAIYRIAHVFLGGQAAIPVLLQQTRNGGAEDRVPAGARHG